MIDMDAKREGKKKKRISKNKKWQMDTNEQTKRARENEVRMLAVMDDVVKTLKECRLRWIVVSSLIWGRKRLLKVPEWGWVWLVL